MKIKYKQMNTPKKILVSLNTLKSSDAVVDTVLTLAKIYQPHFTFLHILSEKRETNDEAEERTNEFYRKMESKGLEANVERTTEFGDFIKLTREKASEMKADMILTESGAQDQNLEYLVPKIMRKTDLPVWCVKRGEEHNIAKIVCPVDFSETSNRAFTDALQLAGDMQSELVVLTVSEPTESVSGFINESEKELNREQFENEAQNLDEFLANFDIGTVKITKDVKQGSTVEEILRNISAHRAGLLVMGTHARRGIGRKLLGSVTEKVVNDSPVSFLAIKSQSLFD